MATIKDTDLLLVNRGGVDYKITALELKENLNAEPMPWDEFEGPVLHIQELEDPGVKTYSSNAGGAEMPVKVYDLDGNFLEETAYLATEKFGNEFVILVDHRYNPDGSEWSIRGLFCRGYPPTRATSSTFDCKFGPLTDVSMVRDFSEAFQDCRKFTGKGSLGTWNTKLAENMWRMLGSSPCNEDLSQWCVPLIPPGSSASDFVSKMLAPEHEPKWGTCPRGEDQ